MTDDLRILIIEDDPDVALGCEQALQLEGFTAEVAGSAEQGRKRLGADFPGIVVSDIRLPGRDGLSLQRDLHALDPELPVVLITGHGDVSMAVQAMKDGAYDFLQKPFAPEQLVDIARRALEKRRLVLEVRALRRQLDQRDRLEARLIGNSAGMARVRGLIGALANSAAECTTQAEGDAGQAAFRHAYAEDHHVVRPGGDGNDGGGEQETEELFSG